MAHLIQSLADRLMRTGDVQRQSFLHFGTSILVTVLGFLSTMAVTHLSGSPDIPGGYFLFLAYLGIFSMISSGGLGGAAVHLMGSAVRPSQYFSAYLFLRCILLAISLLFLILITPFMVDLSTAGLVPWLIWAVAASSAADIAGTWLYGTGKAGYIQLSTLVNNLVRIGIQVLAVVAGYGVAGLAGSVIAGIAAGVMVMVPCSRFRLERFTGQMMRDILRFSFWTLLASGGMIAYGNIDTILLGYYTSPAEVGLYRISLQLASFALFSALALSTILYPKFTAWQNDERRPWIAGSLERAISYSLVLALPVCAGGLLLGNRLLYYLYGSPYETAGTALSLLLTSQVIYVFVYLWTMTLAALGKPKDSAISALVALAVNIPLNIILIPESGIIGAATALFITVIVHAACAGMFLQKTTVLRMDFRALRSIGSAVLGMILSIGILGKCIPVSNVFILIGTVTMSAIIYFSILTWLERGVHSALRQMIKNMGIVLPEWL